MKTAALITLLFTALSGAFAQIDEAIKFKITSPLNHTDETIIRLEDTSTPAFDPQWDGWKIFTWNDTVPSLYSHTNDQYPLTINAIPTMQADTSVHLWVRAKITSGTYNISTEQMGSFPADVKICMRDLETGQTFELNQNISYDFHVTADPVNDQMRFEIFYSRKSEVAVLEDDATLYNNGNFNWTYEIQDDTYSPVMNGSSVLEQADFIDMPAGDYLAIVTDEYNLTDTVLFTIDSQTTDDPAFTMGYAQKETTNQSTANLFDQENGNHKVYKSDQNLIVSTPETGTYAIYSVNGQLIQSGNLDNGNNTINLYSISDSQLLIVHTECDGIQHISKVLW